MSSSSTRIGLKRPVTSDPFQTSDEFDNLSLLDSFPGIFICTSGSRPGGWGAGHEGMLIHETDTDLYWRWTGAAFVRLGPLGLLADPVELTTDFSTAATSPTAALQASGVIIPATNAGSTTKRVKVTGTWYGADNGTNTTLGACEISLYYNSTRMKTILCRGRPTTAASPLDWGVGGTISACVAAAAGSQNFSLRINSLASVGGTSTLRASATTPAQLIVEEVGL